MITDLPTLQSVFKHYHSNKHFSRSFTHKMAAKTSWHIDMERNYVIVALCIYWNWTKRARLQKPSESLKSFAECLQQRGRAAILSIGDADAVQYAGIAMRTRSIYIDQCSSTSNSWCLLNDRTHSRCIHYMHAWAARALQRTVLNLCISVGIHAVAKTFPVTSRDSCVYLTATIIYYQQGCSIGYLYRYLICT